MFSASRIPDLEAFFIPQNNILALLQEFTAAGQKRITITGIFDELLITLIAEQILVRQCILYFAKFESGYRRKAP
jgi:hypothetical protein